MSDFTIVESDTHRGTPEIVSLLKYYSIWTGERNIKVEQSKEITLAGEYW